jgi:vesicle-fusing ATPase
MVATRCFKPTYRQVQSSKAGSRLSFSSKQIETFRQIAQKTRQSVLSGGSKKLASSLPGVLAVFSGSSGTGKTMAAEVIARELRTSLYRVNLNQVGSKYIGETEKNLARVFEAAQKKGTVLLFDEADALLGKRSEVQDSHDRYANVEVSYLLAKVEAYSGLVILTSNRKVDLDPKIVCHVKYQLEFSPPIPSPLSQPGR